MLDFSHKPRLADLRTQEHEAGHGYVHQIWRYRGSDGDEVHASVWLSTRERPGPIVIAGHGASGDRNAPYIRGAAKAWARSGLAVAAIDFPLHGPRADPRAPSSPVWRSPELMRRAVADLRLLVDAVETRPDFDPARVGYVGFSMGTLIGVPFMASEPRVRSAVFAVAGSTGVLVGDQDPVEAAISVDTDPATYAASIAPRPVLMLCADRDEVFSRDSALALFDAFLPPKELVFFPGTHGAWAQPGRRYRTMRDFFAETLGEP